MLKSCPFCGQLPDRSVKSERVLRDVSDHTGAWQRYYLIYWVECFCGARGPKAEIIHSDHKAPGVVPAAELRARIAWNEALSSAFDDDDEPIEGEDAPL